MNFENLTKMQKLRIQGTLERENDKLAKERVYSELLKDSMYSVNKIIFLNNDDEELVLIEQKDKDGNYYYRPCYKKKVSGYTYPTLDQGLIAAVALKNSVPENSLGFVFKGFGMSDES